MTTVEMLGRRGLVVRKALVALALLALDALAVAAARTESATSCSRTIPVVAFVAVLAVWALLVTTWVSLEVITSGRPDRRGEQAGRDGATGPTGPTDRLLARVWGWAWEWADLLVPSVLLAEVAAAAGVTLWWSWQAWAVDGDGPCSVVWEEHGAISLITAACAVAAIGYVATLVMVALRTLRRLSNAGPTPPATPGASAEPSDTAGSAQAGDGGVVICCSGGGIRSASFSLGGLQRLAEEGIYHKAQAVVAVSGGGYMATAFHALRRQKEPDRGGVESADVFTLESPELQHLRRETRYLVSSPARKVKLAFSLLFGSAVNIILVLSVLRVLAWVLGWAIADVVAAQRDPGDPGHVLLTLPGYHGRPGWLYAGPAAIVAAILLYLVARIMENICGFQGQSLATVTGTERPSLRHPVYRIFVTGLDPAVPHVLRLGAVLALLWPGIPWTHRAVDALGRLSVPWNPLAALGLRDAFALIPAAVAFAGLVGTALRAPAPGDGGGRRFSATRVFRLYVVPWLGATIVLGSGYLILMNWCTDYVLRTIAPAAGRLPAGPMDGGLWLAAVAVVVLRVFINANMTTLYPFYRDRLADAYLMKTADGDGDVRALRPREIPTVAAAAVWERDPLRRVTPELVLCATANVSDEHLVPAGRRATSFIMSGSRVGLPDVNLPERGCTMQPQLYEGSNRRGNSLASAMAISGAALAPSAGRESGNVRPYRLLMTLANVRLGVWMKNPYWVAGDQTRQTGVRGAVHWLADNATFPGPGMILYEGLGLASLSARFLYITDGGHLDNLGLVEALRRRPSPHTIFVLDASADPVDSFSTLSEAIATARMDLNIDVSGFALEELKARKHNHVRRAWATGVAVHPAEPTAVEQATHAPPDRTTRIVYVKALYTRGLSQDLDGYKAKHPEFPNTGTTDQIYDEFDLEAFRQLGWKQVDTYLRSHVRADAEAAGETGRVDPALERVPGLAKEAAVAPPVT